VPLEKYQDKRHFDRTPEPAGDTSAHTGSREPARVFVVQKHAASRLHYDFRLEIDGVLASWAIPKGPSLDTKQRRLAMHVEDHPLEYGSFEGTIPQGEYGGGTVMLWDRGTYEPVGDMDEEYAAGKAFKFRLHGEKLQGGFTLVHLKPREGDKKDNSWLLIKERDEHARPSEGYDVLTERPESIATGRDLDAISRGDAAADSEPPPAAHVDSPPADTPVQLARLTSEPPEGDGWIREVKYDGYRVRVVVERGTAQLLTRNGKDWTDRFERVALAASGLPITSALLDGEIVALNKDGTPDFAALQRAMSSGDQKNLAYMAFDLLSMDGWDLREIPLQERKGLLSELLETAGDPTGPIRLAEGVDSDGAAFHDATCELGLEGSISKRADAPYRAGRTPDWLKVKCLARQEFVIGGFTEPGGSRAGFGALLLGTFEGGELRYAGRVGTGFTDDDLMRIRTLLDERELDASPFATTVRVPGKHLHWVRPDLVCEVTFQEWTTEGLLRHPSFKGLREDKPAEEISRESPAPPPAAGSAADIAPSPAPATDSAPVTVAGITISKPGKVLFEPRSDGRGTSASKLDLARYYEAVAPRMLAHSADRPLTLVRCPHGTRGDCFYQKHPDSRTTLPALHTVDITEHDALETYLYLNDAAGLVALAQLGVLEIHAWNSLATSPELPDRIVFDLDPGPGVPWKQIANAASLLRDALAALDLTAFLKATGGKGLHVVVPIVPDLDHTAIRAFARMLAERIERHDPEHFTTRMALSARSGRIFIDHLRNAHGATSVEPFSTRSREGAPIALPLAWSELPISEPFFTLEDGIALARNAENPWEGYETARASITREVLEALAALS